MAQKNGVNGEFYQKYHSEKMKLGILTFHCAVNYGAVLQAFALQEYLTSMGHEVTVIDYRPEYLISPYRISNVFIPQVSFFSRVKYMLRSCMIMPIRFKRNRVFSRFVNNRLHLTKLDFADSANDYDAFIVGSDQIWNPRITEGFDDAYFCNFAAARNKRTISYAASAGSVENIVSSEQEEAFFLKLSGIDNISVREMSLGKYLTDNGRNACIAVDPVLLAGKYVFAGIAQKPKREKPYLLLFQLWVNPKIVKFAESVADSLGLEIVSISSSSESVKKAKIQQSLSPEEFVGYFYYASYIITTSFHGTAFSILFGKDFNIVSTDRRNSERMTSLLSSLGLEARMSDLQETPDISHIDYPAVKSRLAEIAEKSRDFLSQSLGIE